MELTNNGHVLTLNYKVRHVGNYANGLLNCIFAVRKWNDYPADVMKRYVRSMRIRILALIRRHNPNNWHVS